MSRTFVLFASSFAYEQAPNIDHEARDDVKTWCGRLLADAATNEPEDRDHAEPACITCCKAKKANKRSKSK